MVTAEGLEAALTDVWARMRSTVLARVDVLDDAVVALIEERLDEPRRAEAERAAHKLVGSAGTFGYHQASRLARRLEHRFASGARAGAWQAAEEVVALRDALEGGQPPSGSVAALDAERRAAILLVSTDGELADRLRRAGSMRGLEVVVADAPAGVRRALAVHAPAAVLVDGQLGDAAVSPSPPVVAIDGSPENNRALSLVGASGVGADTPMMLLTDAVDQVDRVAAARAGVSGFLPRRLDADAIAEAVDERVRSVPVERVLACDDDPSVLDAVTAVLAQERLVVNTVSDPREFWDLITAQPPDLVLLDIDMPHVDGFELCRTLRHDPTHATRPVMFLTGHAHRDLVQRAFDAGADDVIAKPVVAPELQARVRNRLDRSRLLRRLAENDSLTGLHNRRASLIGLERIASSARRYEQPMCLGVIDLDRFKAVNDTHGHAAGDAVLREVGRRLRSTFRSGDVTARWGGDELVVGMYGMGRHDGVARLAELLEGLRTTDFDGDGGPFRVSFSAGVAEHPTDGGDVPALYRAADQALRLAKGSGGDRVHTCDPATATLPDVCDVAVVDDDAALVELLAHALTTRGYEVVVVDDGGEARRRLVGEAADLQPRVVLLDVDLPAFNGIDLLAELRRAGLLNRMRVVMLTGRSDEQEVIDTLRLGAVDHVAKPFSVPVLLERVRHALSA